MNQFIINLDGKEIKCQFVLNFEFEEDDYILYYFDNNSEIHLSLFDEETNTIKPIINERAYAESQRILNEEFNKYISENNNE